MECGYCGGQISPSSGKRSAASGRTVPKESPVKKATEPVKPQEDEEEDEEGGGLSPFLQPGEQVQIGSLNVSVKKFFFHAYLTDKRIFLIDTQEKKIKVTAKDVARDTIADSTTEFSENSDPVLILSIRSPDEEIKTMKIVFVQNGIDRSTEIDEWLSLLQNERSHKKSSKKRAEEPDHDEEDPTFIAPVERPVVREGLHPTLKPAKDHEKQPPVKRLVSIYKVPEEVKEPEPVEEELQPRAPVRQQEQTKKSISIRSYKREIPTMRAEEPKPQRKPEVQAAMKVAMKSSMQPLRQPSASHPVRSDTAEPMYREPITKTETAAFVEILPDEPPEYKEKPVREEAGSSMFCHNCGKKIPQNANFCPGCGTKLSAHKSGHAAAPASPPALVSSHSHADFSRKVPKIIVSSSEEDEEEDNEPAPAPVKPLIKKVPPNREMTILHKFLRR
ncbi:MAG: zinc ribbon domain-containing protein [Methanomicrobiales archaeon]